MLITKQILRGASEHAMDAYDRHPDECGMHQQWPDTSEEQHEGSSPQQHPEHLIPRERMAPDRQIPLRRAEDVEGDPGEAEEDEEEEWRRVGNEGDNEHETKKNGIVDAEVSSILEQARGSFGERAGTGEGSVGYELGPRALLGEETVEGVGEVGDEHIQGGVEC